MLRKRELDYYTSREKEYVYELYELISSIETEYSDVVSKRERINRIFDDRLLLRGQLEIIDEDSFMDIEKFCNNQYSVIKAEKRVNDNISDTERKIESAKEEIRGLRDKNETVDILSILNEFGIIDTYNSDNGVNVRDSMYANFDTDKESSSGNGDTDSDDMNDPEYSALLLEEDLLNDEVNENNPYGYSDFPLSDENEVYGEISNRGYDGLDDNVIVNVGDSGDIDLDSVRATANGVMKEVIDNVILDSGNDSNESNSVDIDTSTSNSGDTVKEADDVKSDNEEVVVHDSAKPEEEKFMI